MLVEGVLHQGKYYDSVTLMRAAKELKGAPGVEDAAIVMGSAANKDLLRNANLFIAAFEGAKESDLIIAVSAKDAESAQSAIACAGKILDQMRKAATTTSGAPMPLSLEGALAAMAEANLALISIPGRYAAREAMKALRRGLHVMLFSDNVSIEEELELKRYALAHDLLVMGPDCGTAIINGVPLAFANAVARGSIGVVGASGTGMQEVTALISRLGGGISQAIGAGGRDIKQEIGGITFLQGLEALEADPATRVIVMVAKPPHPAVLAKISARLATTQKPCVALFLGSAPGSLAHPHVKSARTLEEAAHLAVALERGESQPEDGRASLAADEAALLELAKKELATRSKNPQQKFLRALYSGGTLCDEGQLILEKLIGPIFSNTPVGTAQRLTDATRSQGHTLVDLGDDAFTVGRPHPMIDYSLRCERMLAEAGDPAVAVILFDVVLGFGSHPDPKSELLPVIHAIRSKAPHITLIASLLGTPGDPQGYESQKRALAEVGVHVCEAHARAARLSGAIIRQLKG